VTINPSPYCGPISVRAGAGLSTTRSNQDLMSEFWSVDPASRSAAASIYACAASFPRIDGRKVSCRNAYELEDLREPARATGCWGSSKVQPNSEP
jgi:hypothetical protein